MGKWGRILGLEVFTYFKVRNSSVITVSFAQGKIMTVPYTFQNARIHECKYINGPLLIFIYSFCTEAFPGLLAVFKTLCMRQTLGGLNAFLVPVYLLV